MAICCWCVRWETSHPSRFKYSPCSQLAMCLSHNRTFLLCRNMIVYVAVHAIIPTVRYMVHKCPSLRWAIFRSMATHSFILVSSSLTCFCWNPNRGKGMEHGLQRKAVVLNIRYLSIRSGIWYDHSQLEGDQLASVASSMLAKADTSYATTYI